MDVHVLSGDSLVEPFNKTGINGEVVVCRECLVDGDLRAEGLEGFWALREKYLAGDGEKEADFYEKNVRDEFIRLWNLADGNTVNLWFEYELFCQVNMWFTIWLLRNTEAQFYIVYPKVEDQSDIWKGFAFSSEDQLTSGFNERIKLNHDDVFLAVRLWEAFQNRDFENLKALGETESKAFPTLSEVCEAAVQIETRPVETLRSIVSSGKTEFGEAFQEFVEQEGVYGFGDMQVRKIFDGISSP